MKSGQFLPGAALLTLAFASVLWSQELPTAKPQSVGLSPEKLARIGPAVQALVTGHKVAGAITMITRRGKVVCFEAFGQRDIDSGQPMERDTIMRFYSMWPAKSNAAFRRRPRRSIIGKDSASCGTAAC